MTAPTIFDGDESEHPELLTVDEVAAAFRADPEWVMERVKAGDLEAVRLGGRARDKATSANAKTTRITTKSAREFMQRGGVQ